MKKSVISIAAVAAFGASVAIAPTAIAAPAKDKTITVHQFNGKNGAAPTAAPTCVKGEPYKLDGMDWCFGATYVGGSTNNGSLWMALPDLQEFMTIGNFDLGNGLTPSQSPVINADRTALYGVTSQAGSSGLGVIYTYDLTTSISDANLTSIASFTPATGTTSQAPPIIVGDVLYGVTGQNGKGQGGTIWRFDTKVKGAQIEVLHDFQAGSTTDVAIPFGALTHSPAEGLLYGMAFNGGANGLGGIFSIKPDGSDYRLRTSFDQTTGGAPQMGAMLLSQDGTLYANTWNAAANNGGAVVQFDPGTNATKVIFNYNSTTGVSPYNSLAEAKSGKYLYSVTWRNNAKGGLGAIVAIDKGTGKAKVLHNFTQTEGAKTFAGATVSPDGKRILTQMSGGGKNGVGTAVSFVIPKAFR